MYFSLYLITTWESGDEVSVTILWSVTIQRFWIGDRIYWTL
jgi:hypothetical protein